jgi:hypothetical protein
MMISQKDKTGAAALTPQADRPATRPSATITGAI